MTRINTNEGSNLVPFRVVSWIVIVFQQPARLLHFAPLALRHWSFHTLATVMCLRVLCSEMPSTQALAEAPSFFLEALSVVLSINLVLPT